MLHRKKIEMRQLNRKKTYTDVSKSTDNMVIAGSNMQGKKV